MKPRRFNLIIVLIGALSLIITLTLAGSLTPPGAPGSTMNSLEEIYNAIGGIFDSSGLSADEDGNLIENLKYISNNLFWASSGNDIYSLNSGNIGVGTTTPLAKLTVNGDIVPVTAPSITATTRTTTQIPDDDWVGSYLSIAIGTDGLPVISHQNEDDGNIMITKCENADCSNNTTTQITNADYVGYGGTSIAIGADGLPVVSYKNIDDFELMITKCGNAFCSSGNTTTQIADADNVGAFSSIAIGTDGLPIISYSNATDGDLMITKCGNSSCSSGNTTTQIADADDVGYYTSLAIGTDGLPIIAYDNFDYGKLIITKCADSSCAEEEGTALTGGSQLGGWMANPRSYSVPFQTINTLQIANPTTFYNFSILTAGSERLTITPSGNVGIGTTAPTEKLSIGGNVNIAGSQSLFEGFENETFPPTGWTTGGNANWARSTTTEYAGVASAASGAIGDNQSTWIDRDYTFSESAQVKFYWKVSSEDESDFLVFCLDNDACTRDSGYTYRISGEANWSEIVVSVSAGSHSFRWLYGKDSNTVEGSDKAWIDNVRFISSSGGNLYVNNNVGIGTITPSEKLTVANSNILQTPGTPSPIGGVTLDASHRPVHSVFISGKYAYLARWASNDTCSGTTLDGCEFSIFDISNPSSPTPVGGADLSYEHGNGVYVSGRYAYVVKGDNAGTCSGTTLTGCEFSIFDISNPSTPSPVGGVDLADNVGYTVYVSGRYAYITKQANAGTCSGTTLTGCEFSIYDISNPSTPSPVGGADLTGEYYSDVYISGRYAYITKTENSSTCSGVTLDGCEFSIFDISNPSSPTPVGGVDLEDNGEDVFISGRYAYVVKDTVDWETCSGTALGGCELSIYDISNPSSPTAVGGVDVSEYVYSIFVSGRYAHILKFDNTDTCSGTTLDGCEYAMYDVSNPSSPSAVGGVDLDIWGEDIFISGRYAYIGKAGHVGTCSGTTLIGCEFSIYDISGIEVTSAMIHSLEAGNLQVRNDIILQGQLQTAGGINVGEGGLFSSGALSVYNQGYFSGNVGIGTVTPQSKFQVEGYLQLDDGNTAAPADADCNAAAEESRLYYDATNDNFYVCSGASGWRKITTGAPDIAENYSTLDISLEVGDVLAVDPENPAFVIKSTKPYQSDLMGVFSWNRSALGPDEENSVQVALIGRVEVKVSTENGEIKIGDALTSSSTPGVAMKATKSGRVIGMALEPYDGSGEENAILVFVNSHWLGNDLTATENSSGQIINYSAEQLRLDLSSLGLTVTENGTLEIQTLKTKKICLGQTCFTEEELKQLLERTGVPPFSEPEVPSEAQPEETPTPEPTSTPESTPSLIIDSTPIPTPEPTPISEPTPESSPQS